MPRSALSIPLQHCTEDLTTAVDVMIVIDVPAYLKEPLMLHLKKNHGISTETVYNDLHGLIRNQKIHQKECIEVYKDKTQSREDSIDIETS